MRLESLLSNVAEQSKQLRDGKTILCFDWVQCKHLIPVDCRDNSIKPRVEQAPL